MPNQFSNSEKQISLPEVFLGKGVLKTCKKFTGEHPSRSVISINLLCNFIEIALRHGCSPVNLLHLFEAPYPKNPSGRLLLEKQISHIDLDLAQSRFSRKYFFLSKI